MFDEDLMKRFANRYNNFCGGTDKFTKKCLTTQIHHILKKSQEASLTKNMI